MIWWTNISENLPLVLDSSVSKMNVPELESHVNLPVQTNPACGLSGLK